MEGEDNNTLTSLLQNHNSEEEFDNSTLNFEYLNDNFNYNIIKCPEISTLWGCQVIEITSNMLSRKVILGNVYRLPRETSTDHKTFIN